MKRGQIDFSFGMIFSVILIIAFLGFAIYAIVAFLGMKDKVELGKFLNDFQNDVDRYWKESQGTNDFPYYLPIEIKKACFLNKNSEKKGPEQEIYEELKRYIGEGDNLIFYPIGSSGSVKSKKIEHIDLEKATQENNPLCFENKNGKITIILEQEYGGTQLVNLKK